MVVEITANISKFIDEKMDPILQLLQLHRSELDEHNKRITEAETRISAMEDVATPIESKLRSLEKRVNGLKTLKTEEGGRISALLGYLRAWKVTTRRGFSPKHSSTQ